jgi:hypothetical protein
MTDRRLRAKRRVSSRQEDTMRAITRPPHLQTTYALLDSTFSVAGASAALFSALVGNDLLTATAHAGVALFAVGFLLWATKWMLARRAQEAERAEQHRAVEETWATLEWEVFGPGMESR